MDFDDPTAQRYGIEISKLTDPLTPHEKQRNNTLKHFSIYLKLLERDELLRYCETVTKNGEAVGKAHGQHLREPFASVLKYMLSRVDELENELDGQEIMIARTGEQASAIASPDLN